MIRGPVGCLRIDPAKLKFGQIKFLDENIDHANRIVRTDPIFQVLRKRRTLPTIRPLNEALHSVPPQIPLESYHGNHMKHPVFTQPGSKGDLPMRCHESRRLRLLLVGVLSCLELLVFAVVIVIFDNVFAYISNL
jgi:hypothetical protein